jgi:type IV secretion system protein VirB10
MKLGPLFPKRSAKTTVDPATPPTGADEQAHEVAGERGIASVNQGRSLQSRVSNVMAMGLMGVLGFGLLSWYYAQTLSHRHAVREHAQASTRSKAQGDMPLPALGRVDPPGFVQTNAEAGVASRVLGGPPPLPQEGSNNSAAYAASQGGASASTSRASPGRTTDRRLEGPVFSGSSAQTDRSGEVLAPAPTASDEIADGGPNERADRIAGARDAAGSVASLLRPAVMPAVRARVLPTRRLLLPKGAFIDCTLETAIDSSLPGLTTCITATDTFGADGTVVLLERGTKLVGETRGEVQQGVARIFVLWSEARTPTGVVVPLASPGTDELGRSGLAGTVDHHFIERFGAAILISMIDGGVQAAAQSTNHGGGTVIYNPSNSTDVVTEVLKGTVNIAPTVRKQNGDRIQILVARDLDFRSVYELRATTSAR